MKRVEDLDNSTIQRRIAQPVLHEELIRIAYELAEVNVGDVSAVANLKSRAYFAVKGYNYWGTIVSVDRRHGGTVTDALNEDDTTELEIEESEDLADDDEDGKKPSRIKRKVAIAPREI